MEKENKEQKQKHILKSMLKIAVLALLYFIIDLIVSSLTKGKSKLRDQISFRDLKIKSDTKSLSSSIREMNKAKKSLEKAIK